MNELNYDKNNWFDRNGVERPTHLPHISDDDLQAAFDKVRRETVHGNWTQNGNQITCHRCPLPHSSTISPNYLLQGTNDKGLPILKKIDL